MIWVLVILLCVFGLMAFEDDFDHKTPEKLMSLMDLGSFRHHLAPAFLVIIKNNYFKIRFKSNLIFLIV